MLVVIRNIIVVMVRVLRIEVLNCELTVTERDTAKALLCVFVCVFMNSM